ncbi:MAG TPA: hypothetical protein DCL96_01415 [Prevotella sp.]|nr:hypothetical protein [Prevotella sp.]
MRSLRRNTLHSSPFARNPLCLSAFRAVKSIRALFTYSSPLFTSLFRRICVSSYASMPRA